MTIGGRRVPVSRPRMRTADDGHELAVEFYEYSADRDPLTWAVMDRMLAGVLTRKFAVVGQPLGDEVKQQSSSRSKSTGGTLFNRCKWATFCPALTPQAFLVRHGGRVVSSEFGFLVLGRSGSG